MRNKTRNRITGKTEDLNHLGNTGASLDGFKTIMTRGRCFGLRDRIYKAVVLRASEEEGYVVWSFCNGTKPAVDSYKDIYNWCDWIGGIDEKFAQECEVEYNRCTEAKA